MRPNDDPTNKTKQKQKQKAIKQKKQKKQKTKFLVFCSLILFSDNDPTYLTYREGMICIVVVVNSGSPLSLYPLVLSYPHLISKKKWTISLKQKKKKDPKWKCEGRVRELNDQNE